jgi:hypothetical protein
MTTPITITQLHYDIASVRLPPKQSVVAICNKAIEIALAEANAQQTYISAEEVRELGAGNAEFQDCTGVWHECESFGSICFHYPTTFNDGEVIKYRAIQAQQAAYPQPYKKEPLDPHAALRAEYQKQVAEGTTGFYLWELKTTYSNWTDIGYPSWSSDCIYRCTDISCYVSKDGEPAIRMLRTDAQALFLKDEEDSTWFFFAGGSEGRISNRDYQLKAGMNYTYRTKATIKLNGEMVTQRRIGA